MRLAYGLLVFLVGCGDDTNMLPVGGGSGSGFPDGGGGTLVDAPLSDAKLIDAVAAPVDASVFMGRVCLLSDPRTVNACAGTGAGGFTVRLGTASAVTSADGTFFITGQSGGNLVWHVTGSTIKTSHEVLRDYQIPAIPTTLYNSMKAANSVSEVDGEGAVMIEVTRNGAGVAAATAEINPATKYSPFYDGASATAWTQTATSTNGMIWVPGIDVGPGSVSLTVNGTAVTTPIFDDGITFANVILP
jgi:hypothetical protein